MNHRIYFSVCGEGYGHSSRDLAIAEVLERKGAKVLMAGYGYVLERMKKSFRTVEVKREFKMAGKGGAFDIKATIFKSGNSALLFSKILSEERNIIKKFRATCVVADGRGAATLAALQLNIPCIVVANQTSIESFFKNGSFLLRAFGKPVEYTIKTSMGLAEEIIIPDFPPPDTVCIKTLSNDKSIMKKQEFAGPIVLSVFQKPRKSSRLDIKRPFVLTTLGGHEYRRPIFEIMLKVAEKFPKMNFLIFTKFKSKNIPGNVVVQEFAEDISQYMHEAKLIVTQAGHSTAMEIITLGKPALIIPDKGQVEQENNALRMKKLGIAETLDYAHIDPKNMHKKITLLLRERKYHINAARYSRMARKMNGAGRAADIILEYSKRVQVY